jgi:hypothetical protein
VGTVGPKYRQNNNGPYSPLRASSE